VSSAKRPAIISLSLSLSRTRPRPLASTLHRLDEDVHVKPRRRVGMSAVMYATRACRWMDAPGAPSEQAPPREPKAGSQGREECSPPTVAYVKAA